MALRGQQEDLKVSKDLSLVIGTSMRYLQRTADLRVRIRITLFYI